MKKKLSQRVYDAIFPPKANTSKRHKREYGAAKVNRLNADWTVRPTTANWNLRQSLHILRARARQMCRDTSHFAKFLIMCRQNIIGPKGIQLKCQARMKDGKTLDVMLNKQVEEVFWQWSHRETCTISGKLDWRAAQRLFVTHLARDGEVLVQKVAADNEFGFALKFWNVDYLDEMFNQRHSNGNRIIMSVEIDDNDKPVAYWLRTPPSDVMFSVKQQMVRVRIPAEQMIHAFLVQDDESQVRGVTWFHAALLDAKNLHGYKEGVIMSARLTANTFGIWEKSDPDEVTFTGQENEDGVEKDIEMDVAPLSMNIGPDGYKFNQFDPKQPTQNHAEFYRSIVRDLAISVGTSYFSLQGDMEVVNFSSARVGLEEERELWQGLQDFVITTFCREVYHEFLRSATLNRKLNLTAEQFKELQNPKWKPRGWGNIDPLKDMSADVMGLESKLTTYTRVLARDGVDLVDHLEELASEQALAAAMGIDLTPVTSVKVADAGNAPADEEGNPAKTEPKRGYSNGLDVGDYDN
jgi:lambda family phage portal protein